MTEFIANFSNREVSLFVWMVIAIIAMLLSKSIRNIIVDIFKDFFEKSIRTIFFLFLVYVSIIVIGLFKLGFWEWSLLKDTIFWTFGFAIVLVFRANTTRRKSDFKPILKDAVKWTVIIEFLVAFYTFSLTTELIILPFIVFIGTLQAHPDTDEKYSQVSKILKNTLSLVGLGILGYVAYKTFYQIGELITIINFKSLVLPIILTALFIPFIYLLSLFMIYENLFIRLKFLVKDDKIRKKVKRQILRIANLNLDKLSNISENIFNEEPLSLENSFKKIKQISEHKGNLLDK
jgi:hypothetical protein